MDRPLDLVKASPLFTSKRTISLYSDFRRLKESNEDGYNANVAAWKAILTAAVSPTHHIFPDTTLFSASDELVNAFYTPENGRPLALDVVLDELVQDQTFVPLSRYLDLNQSIYYDTTKYWSGWAWNKFKSVSGLGTISNLVYSTSPWKSSNRRGGLKNEKYVCIKTLDQVSSGVFKKLKSAEYELNHSYSHTVFTKQLFYSAARTISIHGQEVSLSNTDLDCVIVYLSRDKPCITRSTNGDTIKIHFNIEHNSNNNNNIEPVTQQDRAVANLRDTIDQLTRRVDGLSDKIEQCTNRAKESLLKKNKQVAKYALQSKRLAESAQVKCLDMLSNLEHVLGSIDHATSRVDIVSALQSGISIVGKLNQAIGGAEKVSELMDQLRDQLSESDEIGNEIAQLAGSTTDEQEIEDELQELEVQENAKILGKLTPPSTFVPQQQAVEEEEELVENTKRLQIAE